jgi:acetoacetate decarboxylase
MAQIGRLTLDKMGYSMPVDAPAYQAPPFHYRNAQAISIKFETDLDAALDALSAPLELIEPATANLSFYWYPPSPLLGRTTKRSSGFTPSMRASG